MKSCSLKSCFYVFRSLVIILALLVAEKAFSQISVHKIEPAFWWIGMKNKQVQLMVYGNNIKGATVKVMSSGVKVLNVQDGDSPNYLFVTILVPPTTPAGKIQFQFEKNNSRSSWLYELKKRKKDAAERKGFNQSDVVYLIMPDRFVNGDSSNDQLAPMSEKLNRKKANGRHGGDLSGIIGKLDYLKQLGVTTIWNTPLWEDNADVNSYHGYAATDFYNIDPRYGSNEQYALLSKECHRLNMKLIMDVVPNHCSVYHPWMKDLPTKDWVHVLPENYKRSLSISAWTDPYVSNIDFVSNKDGWFTEKMPDLNQDNNKVWTYLVQNTIWWIEFAGLDGLRVDTYPYSDKKKIADWTKAIMTEYPSLNIVGEIWQPNSSSVAYWQKNANNADHYNSNLPCVMDFPLIDQMWEAFDADSVKREKGIRKLYTILGMDYLYPDRNNIMTFLDNHDTERFASAIEKDKDLFKMALTFLLTTRGIPQIYSGTEIMQEGQVSNSTNRNDFPGGWQGDARNAFSKTGRTAVENEVFDYLNKLLLWRKNTPAIWSGKLMHFKPESNLYVYFRYNENSRFMVILNTSTSPKTINTSRYKEMLNGYSSGRDVITGYHLNDLTTITIAAKTAIVIELK
ncbi:MAG TPA: glycoside hydrolase family 13 protein [Chitinophagaceae bacterium]